MWLYWESKLGQQERKSARAMGSALGVARNRLLVRPVDASRLVGDQGLCAVSPHARRIWGKAFCKEFSDHFALDDNCRYPDKPQFMFTLVDTKCVTAHDATSVDIPRFKTIFRAGLRGLSYVGMIEPAYYVNICAGAHCSMKRAISWHVHGFAWGETAREMKRRFENLNVDQIYKPIADGLLGAHARRIPKSQLADKFRYILKSPRRSYRVYKYEWITKDGEVINGFKQKTIEPRPGERVTLFLMMKDMTLDELSLAGGEGVSMLRRIKRSWIHYGPHYVT